MTDEFRWCVHCGADCWPDKDDQEHASDCPVTTGLWPVTMAELGMRGPDDPYAHGMVCMDCNTPFELGDVYALRPTDEGDVFEIVCVGCRVLTPEPGA